MYQVYTNPTINVRKDVSVLTLLLHVTEYKCLPISLFVWNLELVFCFTVKNCNFYFYFFCSTYKKAYKTG